MLALAIALTAAVASAKPKEYTAVRVDLEGLAGLCPGQEQKLELMATDSTGKETKVKFGAWKQFQITWDTGPVTPKGSLAMPTDPRASWGKPGALSVQLIADPSVHAEAALPVRYDCLLEVDDSGEAGQAGARGDTGSTGADADGGDGQDGGDGGDGRDGHDTEVRVTLVKEPTHGVDVLQIQVKDLQDGRETLVAIAADGGKLGVYANGGAGGQGGPGGNGGSGATNRNGGGGGDGGDGGKGGKGGHITLIVDPSAKGRTSGISLFNGAGAAGTAGLPGDGGAAYDPGQPGEKGHPGHDGQAGIAGPAAETKSEAVAALW